MVDVYASIESCGFTILVGEANVSHQDRAIFIVAQVAPLQERNFTLAARVERAHLNSWAFFLKIKHVNQRFVDHITRKEDVM